MEPRHERIARIALAAGARYGLALAGGYAVAAHGMGNRPSGDVDLFTSWQHRGEFPELAAAVVGALEVAGYKVSVIMSAETFTRLTLASPEGGGEEKVELAVDWRAHEPVQLDVGPEPELDRLIPWHPEAQSPHRVAVPRQKFTTQKWSHPCGARPRACGLIEAALT
jgi:hypothetical protein